MSMARSARSVRSAVATPRASRPSSTFCCTVSHGSSAKVWKTMVVSRLLPVSRSPRNSTSPSVGAISPAMQRSRVDLPLPLRPSRATNSPSATSRLMSSSTVHGPPAGPANDLLSDRTLISGSPAGLGLGRGHASANLVSASAYRRRHSSTFRPVT